MLNHVASVNDYVIIKEVEVERILSNRKSGTRELSGRDKSREALGF